MGGVVDAPSLNDPGDDTARRFRYQYELTASYLCALLEENGEVLEVYCEHHEDALIRYKGGGYLGVQVKTRESGLELWRANDDEMVGAFAKFAKKEHEFPGAFSGFRLATNHQFWRNTKNGKNIPHLLELAASSSAPPTQGILASFIKTIAAKASAPLDSVLKTLQKTVVADDGPKFKDSITAVVDALVATHPPCAAATHPRAKAAAQALADAVCHASSLKHEQNVPRYVILAEEPAELEMRAALDGKRFTRDRVHAVLATVLSDAKALLGDDSLATPPPPSTESRLRRKLTAGDLSIVTIHSAVDCWSSACHQHLQWVNRFGDREASRRLNHVKSVLLNEAASAYEATKSDSDPFGAAMLDELRRRVIARLSSDTDFFGLDQEHLLGYAYILTEDCKIWFSQPFDLGVS